MSDLGTNTQRKIDALVQQMHAAFAKQEWQACEQLCVQIESWNAEHPEPANVRGIVAMQTGDVQHAEAYFVKAVNAAPEDARFQMNLGKLYLRQGVLGDALARFQSVLQQQDEHLEALLGAAQSLLQLGDVAQAKDLLLKAKSLHDDVDAADILLAQVHLQEDAVAEAKACLHAVLARTEGHPEAMLALVLAAVQEADWVAAEEVVLQLIERQPYYMDAYPWLAALHTFDASDDAARIEQMVQMRQQVGQGSVVDIMLSFVLAKAMEDTASYAQAFEYVEKANEKRRAMTQYQHNAELEHLAHIGDHNDADFVRDTCAPTDDVPVFIVGMPRSGASLVEHILTAHADVSPLAKQDLFEISLAGFHDEASPLTLEKMHQMPKEDWQQIGQEYIRLVRESGVTGGCWVDATLGNIRLLGAIHKALPQAKIVHVRRDAMDACWSMLKHNFAGNAFGYTYSLSELGYYYRAYVQLMEHWQEVLPEGVLCEQSYEELVQHQDIEILRLLSDCGLSSDDACFHSHQYHLKALAPHQIQVRKPIYADAIGTWKHYETPLQPLKQILES